MNSIPSPVDVLRRYNLKAKKSWGQCFLHDRNIISRIVTAADISANDTVIEIGAGLGTLTHALAQQSNLVIAIERDRDLTQVLRDEFADCQQVEVREENALLFDFGQFGSPVKVVGNLPYNISSPLLFHLLQYRPYIQSATIMLQLEVAERLVAKPGSRDYGIPSVLCRQAADVHLCFVVPSGAFVPRPKVDSAIVRLDMLPQPRLMVNEQNFLKVVRAAFQYRRKTLRRALSSAFSPDQVNKALYQSGIDGKRRGETLSLEEFGSLSELLIKGG